MKLEPGLVRIRIAHDLQGISVVDDVQWPCVPNVGDLIYDGEYEQKVMERLFLYGKDGTLVGVTLRVEDIVTNKVFG